MENATSHEYPSTLEHQKLPSPSISRKIVAVASIAAGIQSGWALQLSLLTPYLQLLGVPHKWTCIICLCGPISGLLVQPLTGYYSDRCISRFGRRRPFILAGTALVFIAFFLIGFAADVGVVAGDSLSKHTKPRAVVIFVLGFWIFHVANHILHGPCRALLADLSAHDHQRMRRANAIFSFFMAVGNVLGYAAGSYHNLYKIFPFTITTACDFYCANLKTCFIFSIGLLLTVTTMAVVLVSEDPHTIEEDEDQKSSVPFMGELFRALGSLSRPMRILLIVTSLNWIAWFPFFLYDTDWMGREVYGGVIGGTAEQVRIYDLGVRSGSLGLMLNSAVLGLTSHWIEPMGRLLGGTKNLWGAVNLLLAIGLGSTVAITKMSEKARGGSIVPPPSDIRAYALSIFALLGIPLSITFSVPFALASIYCSTAGGGQGLSLGVLNQSILMSQVMVSIVSGPLDASFGGGNLPAFVMGSIAAVVYGFCAIFMLPYLPQQPPKTAQIEVTS